jgi:tetratricopeptide (TPR) repeat protein
MTPDQRDGTTEALQAQAQHALSQMNLEEARARFDSGDSAGGKEHLDLARTMGASDEEVRAIRRHARLLRVAKKQARPQPAPPEPEGNDPLWSLPPNDPRLRFAMTVETYPTELRAKLQALGTEIANATLHLEEGRPEEAARALAPLAQQAPVARYERARALVALERISDALHDLEIFVREEGHHRIGTVHVTGMLAELLLRQNRPEEALTQVDLALQVSEDTDLLILRIRLLRALGRLDEAQNTTSRAMKVAPRSQQLYALRAANFLDQGDRHAAASTLEAGLKTCCTGGRCSAQRPSAQNLRLLARIYLEDQREPQRARELLSNLAQQDQEPTWDDGYLSALAARNQRDPNLERMVKGLSSQLRDGDRRHQVLARAFSTPTDTLTPP